MSDQANADRIRFYLSDQWRRRYGDIDPMDLNPGPRFEQTMLTMIETKVTDMVTIRNAYNVIAEHGELSPMVSFDRTVDEIHHLFKLITTTRPNRVVDAGCGVGLILAYLAKVFPDVQFYGYDVSPRSVERAKERIRILGCRNVTLFVLEHKQLSDEQLGGPVDLVYTRNALWAGFIRAPDEILYMDRDDLFRYVECDLSHRETQKSISAIASNLSSGGVYACLMRASKAYVTLLVFQALNAGMRWNGETYIFSGLASETLVGEYGEDVRVELARLLGPTNDIYTDSTLFKNSSHIGSHGANGALDLTWFGALRVLEVVLRFKSSD